MEWCQPFDFPTGYFLFFHVNGKCKFYTNRSSIYTKPVWVPNRVLQSRNPDPKFLEIPLSRGLYLTSHLPSILQSRNSSRFCFQTPHPELQMREIPGPEKPIEDPHKWSRTRIRIKKYVVSKNQSAFVWTRPKRFSGVNLMKLFQM